jgi:hypothetical protein
MSEARKAAAEGAIDQVRNFIRDQGAEGQYLGTVNQVHHDAIVQVGGGTPYPAMTVAQQADAGELAARNLATQVRNAPGIPEQGRQRVLDILGQAGGGGGGRFTLTATVSLTNGGGIDAARRLAEQATRQFPQLGMGGARLEGAITVAAAG